MSPKTQIISKGILSVLYCFILPFYFLSLSKLTTSFDDKFRNICFIFSIPRSTILPSQRVFHIIIPEVYLPWCSWFSTSPCLVALSYQQAYLLLAHNIHDSSWSKVTELGPTISFFIDAFAMAFPLEEGTIC